jgi:hypothetical protein
VLLLLGAVLYYVRATTGFPAAALSPSAGAGAGASPSLGPVDPSPSDLTPSAGGDGGSPSVEAGTIKMHGVEKAIPGAPNQTVQLRGIYHGGPDTFVRAELRVGAGWVPYAYEAKTDRLGRFITYIEIARLGPHWVRVVDTQADVASEPFVVLIDD